MTGERLLSAAALRGAIVAWLCALGSVTALTPHLSVPESVAWLAGLASHWQWLYATLGLAGAAVALAGRRYAGLLAVAMLLTGWSTCSHEAESAAGDQRPSTTLTVATANLNFQQLDHKALTDWLTAPSAPDVITLQEFTDSARVAVDAPEVRAVYPHRVLAPSPDQFGLAILSRYPLSGRQRVPPANALATLKLRVVLEVRGRSVALTAVHPMPPINAAYAGERDASLQTETTRLAAQAMPGRLVGDMNDTPWSTGLRGTRPLLRANGLAPTWPNAWGWFSVLPLDHVLVTAGIRVAQSMAGPDLGSDHRPVVVRLVL